VVISREEITADLFPEAWWLESQDKTAATTDEFFPLTSFSPGDQD
jgi:hypothetical protein